MMCVYAPINEYYLLYIIKMHINAVKKSIQCIKCNKIEFFCKKLLTKL